MSVEEGPAWKRQKVEEECQCCQRWNAGRDKDRQLRCVQLLESSHQDRLSGSKSESCVANDDRYASGGFIGSKAFAADYHPVVHTAAACDLTLRWPRLAIMIPTTEKSRTAFLHDAEQEAVRAICNPRSHHSRTKPIAGNEAKSLTVEPQEGTSTDQLVETLFSAWPDRDPQPAHSSPDAQTESDEIWTDSNLPKLCRHIASFLRRPASFDQAMIGTGILLSRMWTVASVPADQSIPIVLFTAVMLLVVVHCPLKAAGMLNHVRGVLEMKRKSNTVYPTTAMLQYILECDILTELEGAQLDFYNHVLRDSYGVMPPALDLQARLETENDLTLAYTAQAFELRLIHNSILQQVYGLSKAYCRPEHIAEPVASLQSRLQRWYQALPHNERFAQDMETMISTDLGLASRHYIAVRYYACHFFLNRPVFYFATHQDLEDAALAASHDSTQVQLRPLEPWVYESCHICLEYATMTCTLIVRMTGHYIGWTDLQLVTSCCLMIILARTNEKTVAISQRIENIDAALQSSIELLGRVQQTPHVRKAHETLLRASVGPPKKHLSNPSTMSAIRQQCKKIETQLE